MTWSPGEIVVYRHLSIHGAYQSGLPLSILHDGPVVVVGTLPHDTLICRPAAADGRNLREVPLAERWSVPRVPKLSPFTLRGDSGPGGRLVIVFPRGRAHSIWIFRGAERVIGWYVNLEDPQIFVGRTISTRDHVLDLWVPGETGIAAWKDEDELEAAVAAGTRTQDQADAYRAEGERVLWERPWPTGWEEAAPDPAWPLPELFDGWDVA